MTDGLDIEWAGEKLQLLAAKAVFWRRTKTLIISDLHLGKSASFRASGVPVPESTTAADLERLGGLLRRDTGSERLIILGDLFHARAGLQAVMMDRVEEWRNAHADLEIILVPGNHDRRSALPPQSWNVKVTADIWHCAPFLFSHEPIAMNDAYVIAGHLHPAIVLRDKFGPSIRAPCFCFGKRIAVLPAFGSFTGMSNIQPRPDDRIFAIGSGEIVPVL